MQRIKSQTEWGSNLSNSFASVGTEVNFYKISVTNMYKDKN